MLSIRGIRSGGGYRHYVEKEAEGEWVGTGAELLDLEGQVQKEAYNAMSLGRHPETGEKLRRLDPADRVYQRVGKDGDEWTRHHYAREIYDLTISAPKTVSILGLVDPSAKEAHQSAVEKVWRSMENRCGDMVIAKYEHHYSRRMDPQTHTHLVAGNLAHDGEKWRTLHAHEWYRAQKQITAFYREALLGQLQRNGYQIRYPEVEGISDELVAKFSQRSQDRDYAIEQHKKEWGVDELSNKQIAVLIRDIREPKQGISYGQYLAQQNERLTPAERGQLRETVERAQEHRHSHRFHLANHSTYDAGPDLKAWEYGEGEGYRAR